MVKTVELGSDDIIVMYVNVGQMPNQRSTDYLADLHAKLKLQFGADQKILMLPMREGNTDMCIVKRVP